MGTLYWCSKDDILVVNMHFVEESVEKFENVQNSTLFGRECGEIWKSLEQVVCSQWYISCTSLLCASCSPTSASLYLRQSHHIAVYLKQCSSPT